MIKAGLTILAPVQPTGGSGGGWPSGNSQCDGHLRQIEVSAFAHAWPLSIIRRLLKNVSGISSRLSVFLKFP
jgi:hypothetical protein